MRRSDDFNMPYDSSALRLPDAAILKTHGLQDIEKNPKACCHFTNARAAGATTAGAPTTNAC